MNILITLFLEFFKIGLFAVGGGLATIPFLSELIDKYQWYTTEMLSNMIAVSEATPGAMGINMATYVGFHTGGGVIGGIITTLGLIAPSIIVICIIAKFLKKFKDSKLVQSVFYGLRPAVTALIASAGLGILVVTLFDQEAFIASGNFIDLIHPLAILLFAAVFVVSKKFKKLHPIALIAGCAVIGILLQM